MKLTEAIQFRQPLFESFNDLENMMANHIDKIDREVMHEFKDMWNDMHLAMEEEAPYINMLKARDIVKATKKILKSPYANYDLTEIMRRTKNEKETRGEYILLLLITQMESIVKELGDPRRQDPSYEVIEDGNGYQILELYNYKAAKMICDRYNLNHCIGSSDTSMFASYGENYGRRTYYIITNAKRAVAIHSGGENPYIITSHDNETEIKGGTVTRGDEEDIVRDLNSSIPINRVIDVILKVIPSHSHRSLENVLEYAIADVEANDYEVIDALTMYNGIKLSAIELHHRPGFELLRNGRPAATIIENRSRDTLFDIRKGIEDTKIGASLKQAKEVITGMLMIGDDELLGLSEIMEEEGNTPRHQEIIKAMAEIQAPISPDLEDLFMNDDSGILDLD